MSNDLVNRLRGRNSPVLDEDAHEAADRIEDLEAALHAIRYVANQGNDIAALGRMARLLAEIDLRACAALAGTPGERDMANVPENEWQTTR